MIPKECKRLAEVDFPIAATNAACYRENNRKTRISSGHISLLHTWWARRPLASCRALLLGILLPDPTDPKCPESFKNIARNLLNQYQNIGSTDISLRHALVSFLSKVTDFDEGHMYISTARELVKAAHANVQHVFDPFSGGGSIPLEALRLGCDATSSELNPVAWLLLKISLEWSARKGEELYSLFTRLSEWVLRETEKRLAPYYPKDDQKRSPLVYLWARTVRCEASGCGATIPLIRNLWLSQSKGRKRAIRISYPDGSFEPILEVFEPKNDNEVKNGTISNFNVTCPHPKCGKVTPRERVQAQLQSRHGGANEALLFAIVRENLGGHGKDYYNPAEEDIKAISKAEQKAKTIHIEMPPAPPGGDTGFRPRAYGGDNQLG